MAYDEDNINRREEMLSRFRESMTRPLSERYFDEDELIEIFDYAGDVGDDYLRLEALMCASRFYPDSETLRQRKAVFYSQYSDDVSNKYIDDNQDSNGMLWDIMRARRNAPADDEGKRKLLNTIVDAYNNFTDEEVIQLIDLVSQLGQIQWLKENLYKLRAKVSFLNILLYEVAVAADTNMDVRMAVDMLEELTELEPYNLYFWLMLAKEYASLDDGEKALNAIDFALAINPDDTPSIFIKAKLLYVNDKPREQIVDMLKRLLSNSPDSPEAVRLLASVYSDMGDKAMACATLADYLKLYPHQAVNIVPDILIYRPENIEELLDLFYKENDENSYIMWASWAQQLAQYGHSDLGEHVIQAFQRNSGEGIFSLFPIENLFMQERFEEVLDRMCEYLENNENTEFDFPTMVVMHVLSMVKIGEYTKAMDFCDFFERNAKIDRCPNIGSRLEFMGLAKVIRQIKNKLKRTTDPLDWLDYDPLKIWE